MGNKWSLNDTGYDDGYADGYNQAIEDLFKKCKELSYKESLETDSSVEFAIVELDDIEEVVEQLKENNK